MTAKMSLFKTEGESMNKIKKILVFALVICISANTAAFAATEPGTSADDGYGITVFEEDFSKNAPSTFFTYSATATVTEAPVESAKYGKSMKVLWNYDADKFIATKSAAFTESAQKNNQKVKISYDILLTEKVRAWLNFWSFNKDNAANLNTTAYFNNDGIFTLKTTATNATNYNKYKNYELNKWYNICVYYDFENHKYSLYVNGDEIVADAALDENLKYFHSFRIDIPKEMGTSAAAVYLDNVTCSVYGKKTVTPTPGPSTEPEDTEEIYELTKLVVEDDFEDLSVGSYSGNKWEYKQHSSITREVVEETGRGKVFQTNIPAKEASDNMFASMAALITGTPYKDCEYWSVEYDIKLTAKGRVYLALVTTNESDGKGAVPALAYFNENGVFRLCQSEVPTNTANYNKYKNYEINKWYAVKIYLNLKKDTFSLFINGDEITRGTALPAKYKALQKARIDISKAQGSPEQDGSTKVLFDNLKIYCPDTFSVKETSIADGRGDILPNQKLTVAFSNNLGTVKAGDISVLDKDSKSVTGYSVNADKKELTIDFSSKPLNFNETYKVAVTTELKDVFGQSLPQKNEISFKTSKKKVYASTPIFADSSEKTLSKLPTSGNVTVSAEAVNPLDNSTDVILVINIYNAQGEFVKMLTEKTSISAGNGKTVSKTIAQSDYNNNTLKAFVISGADAVSQDFACLSAKDIKKASITGNDVTLATEIFRVHNTQILAKGSVSPKEMQPVLLTVYPIEENAEGAATALGELQWADMAYPDSQGVFDFTVDLSAVSEDKKFRVTLDSRQATPVFEDMPYLSKGTRTGFITEINEASTKEKVEIVLKSYIEKGLVEIKENLLTDNAYQTVAEQRPYSEMGDVLTMIEKAASLTEEYNTKDYSSLGEFFANEENEKIVLYGLSEEKTNYKNLSINDKNAVHLSMKEMGKVKSIAEIRNRFKEKVKEKITPAPTPGTKNESGGGGGGRDIVFSQTVPANTKDDDTTLYTDLAEAQWAKEDILKLTEAGIISGDGNGRFRPSDNITREEYLKLLILALGIEPENGESGLYDVDQDFWAAPYIATAVRMGFVTGDNTGNFGVGRSITREDMAVMVYRALQKTQQSLQNTVEKATFFDEANISDYAKDSVSQMQQLGIISGMDTGNFMPKDGGTRAQAARIIYRIFKMLGRDTQ